MHGRASGRFVGSEAAVFAREKSVGRSD